MSLRFYCILQVRAGSVEEVLKRTQTLPGLMHAEIVVGQWDIICYFAAADDKAVIDIVLKNLQQWEEVEHTHSIIAIGKAVGQLKDLL